MQIRTIHFEYTTGCNSRCLMCNYWQNTSPAVLKDEVIISAVSSLAKSGLRKVYFTGGECLLHAERLFAVCSQLLLKYPHLELGLITNGILLEKYYQQIGRLFSKVIISLDTVDAVKYRKIRGANALPAIQRGIHLLRTGYPSVRVNVRMLVLNDTVEDIVDVVHYAVSEQLHHVSFLPEDISNSVAFGRNESSEIAAHADANCLVKLRNAIETVSGSYAQLYGNILPRGCEDLEYIYSVYSGTNKCGRKCTKAVSSCVISASGVVNPCFFISSNQIVEEGMTLADLLDSEPYEQLISDIASRHHPVCRNCACPKELT